MCSKKFYLVVFFLLWSSLSLFSQNSGNGSPEVSSQSFLESVTRLNEKLDKDQKNDLKIILTYYRNLLAIEKSESTKDLETQMKLSESFKTETAKTAVESGAVGFALGLLAYWLTNHK